MSQSPLNSVHLDLNRREEFRRARQGVLNACGSNTLRFQAQPPKPIPDPTATIADAPPGLERSAVMLVEKEHLRHPLKIGLNTIGRLPDNDVVVSDPHVSRRHCTVVVHANNTCELHDTASKNGVLLNGEKLAGPTRLRTGDQIRMGDLILVFMNQNQLSNSGSHPAGRTSLSA
jgi:pSer/pThr/pTyr-binding forkhead associated (FHA) protein